MYVNGIAMSQPYETIETDMCLADRSGGSNNGNISTITRTSSLPHVSVVLDGASPVIQSPPLIQPLTVATCTSHSASTTGATPLHLNANSIPEYATATAAARYSTTTVATTVTTNTMLSCNLGSPSSSSINQFTSRIHARRGMRPPRRGAVGGGEDGGPFMTSSSTATASAHNSPPRRMASVRAGSGAGRGEPLDTSATPSRFASNIPSRWLYRPIFDEKRSDNSPDDLGAYNLPVLCTEGFHSAFPGNRAAATCVSSLTMRTVGHNRSGDTSLASENGSFSLSSGRSSSASSLFFNSGTTFYGNGGATMLSNNSTKHKSYKNNNIRSYSGSAAGKARGKRKASVTLLLRRAIRYFLMHLHMFIAVFLALFATSYLLGTVLYNRFQLDIRDMTLTEMRYHSPHVVGAISPGLDPRPVSPFPIRSSLTTFYFCFQPWNSLFYDGSTLAALNGIAVDAATRASMRRGEDSKALPNSSTLASTAARAQTAMASKDRGKGRKHGGKKRIAAASVAWRSPQGVRAEHAESMYSLYCLAPWSAQQSVRSVPPVLEWKDGKPIPMRKNRKNNKGAKSDANRNAKPPTAEEDAGKADKEKWKKSDAKDGTDPRAAASAPKGPTTSDGEVPPSSWTSVSLGPHGEVVNRGTSPQDGDTVDTDLLREGTKNGNVEEGNTGSHHRASFSVASEEAAEDGEEGEGDARSVETDEHFLSSHVPGAVQTDYNVYTPEELHEAYAGLDFVYTYVEGYESNRVYRKIFTTPGCAQQLLTLEYLWWSIHTHFSPLPPPLQQHNLSIKDNRRDSGDNARATPPSPPSPVEATKMAERLLSASSSIEDVERLFLRWYAQPIFAPGGACSLAHMFSTGFSTVSSSSSSNHHHSNSSAETAQGGKESPGGGGFSRTNDDDDDGGGGGERTAIATKSTVQKREEEAQWWQALTESANTNQKLLDIVAGLRDQVVDTTDIVCDELRYSMRSVWQHTNKWHTGRLVLVAPSGHIPSWLHHARNFLANSECSVTIHVEDDEEGEENEAQTREVGTTRTERHKNEKGNVDEPPLRHFRSRDPRRRRSRRVECTAAEKLTRTSSDIVLSTSSGGGGGLFYAAEDAPFLHFLSHITQQRKQQTPSPILRGSSGGGFPSSPHRDNDGNGGEGREGPATPQTRNDDGGGNNDPNNNNNNNDKRVGNAHVKGNAAAALPAAAAARHYKRLLVVDQASLMPYGLHITVNSFSIEQHLFRLRQVTPMYVYINDDYFIRRDADLTDFVNYMGGPILRLHEYIVEHEQYQEEADSRRLYTYSWKLGVLNTLFFNVRELDYGGGLTADGETAGENGEDDTDDLVNPIGIRRKDGSLLSPLTRREAHASQQQQQQQPVHKGSLVKGSEHMVNTPSVITVGERARRAMGERTVEDVVLEQRERLIRRDDAKPKQPQSTTTSSAFSTASSRVGSPSMVSKDDTPTVLAVLPGSMPEFPSHFTHAMSTRTLFSRPSSLRGGAVYSPSQWRSDVDYAYAGAFHLAMNAARVNLARLASDDTTEEEQQQDTGATAAAAPSSDISAALVDVTAMKLKVLLPPQLTLRERLEERRLRRAERLERQKQWQQQHGQRWWRDDDEEDDEFDDGDAAETQAARGGGEAGGLYRGSKEIDEIAVVTDTSKDENPVDVVFNKVPVGNNGGVGGGGDDEDGVTAGPGARGEGGKTMDATTHTPLTPAVEAITRHGMPAIYSKKEAAALKSKHRRYLEHHAPFIHCGAMFRYIQDRYQVELSWRAWAHKTRNSSDYYPPFMYTDHMVLHPWASSSTYIQYERELRAWKLMKKRRQLLRRARLRRLAEKKARRVREKARLAKWEAEAEVVARATRLDGFPRDFEPKGTPSQQLPPSSPLPVQQQQQLEPEKMRDGHRGDPLTHHRDVGEDSNTNLQNENRYVRMAVPQEYTKDSTSTQPHQPQHPQKDEGRRRRRRGDDDDDEEVGEDRDVNVNGVSAQSSSQAEDVAHARAGGLPFLRKSNAYRRAAEEASGADAGNAQIAAAKNNNNNNNNEEWENDEGEIRMGDDDYDDEDDAEDEDDEEEVALPPRSVLIHLDNEDACAPAVIVTGTKSAAMYAEFTDDTIGNQVVMSKIEANSKLLFTNINSKYSKPEVKEQMVEFLEKYYKEPLFLESPLHPSPGRQLEHRRQRERGEEARGTQRLLANVSADIDLNLNRDEDGGDDGAAHHEGNISEDGRVVATGKQETRMTRAQEEEEEERNGTTATTDAAHISEDDDTETQALDGLFADLMALPLVLIANDEEAFCPLVRSLQFALPRYAGREIVLVHVPPAHGKSVALMRAEQRHPVRHFMPVTLCTYNSKRVRRVSVSAGTPMDVAVMLAFQDIITSRLSRTQRVNTDGGGAGGVGEVDDVALNTSTLLPGVVLRRVVPLNANHSHTSSTRMRGDVNDRDNDEGDETTRPRMDEAAAAGGERMQGVIERIVRAMVIDATTASAGDVHAWSTYNALTRALAVPGQLLALEDFAEIVFDMKAVLSVDANRTHTGEGDSSGGRSATSVTQDRSILQGAGQNSNLFIRRLLNLTSSSSSVGTLSSLLLLSVRDADATGVHWVTGASEVDLLANYPLPSVFSSFSLSSWKKSGNAGVAATTAAAAAPEVEEELQLENLVAPVRWNEVVAVKEGRK